VSFAPAGKQRGPVYEADSSALSASMTDLGPEGRRKMRLAPEVAHFGNKAEVR